VSIAEKVEDCFEKAYDIGKYLEFVLRLERRLRHDKDRKFTAPSHAFLIRSGAMLRRKYITMIRESTINILPSALISVSRS